MAWLGKNGGIKEGDWRVFGRLMSIRRQKEAIPCTGKRDEKDNGKKTQIPSPVNAHPVQKGGMRGVKGKKDKRYERGGSFTLREEVKGGHKAEINPAAGKNGVIKEGGRKNEGGGEVSFLKKTVFHHLWQGQASSQISRKVTPAARGGSIFWNRGEEGKKVKGRGAPEKNMENDCTNHSGYPGTER